MAVVTAVTLSKARCPCGNLYRVCGWPEPRHHGDPMICPICDSPPAATAPFIHYGIERPE